MALSRPGNRPTHNESIPVKLSRVLHVITASRSTPTTLPRTIGRIALGAALALAGTSHLSWNREAFLAQVPTWVPMDPDTVVIASGIVEIGLGGALLAVPRRRVAVGIIVAAFFVAIFPGNISQLTTRTDSFGLDSDSSRAVRLLFQPVLVLWALWSTGAAKALRSPKK
ncbi:MAG: putative rane protein [Glaciihabitans sp.]|nr:putative rane protein [Glaciihabitans sp.]